MTALVLDRDRATPAQVAAHLRVCAADFRPPLAERVDIDAYAEKIVDRAVRHEAWAGDELVALVAVYCNDPQRMAAFITSVSVLPSWRGRSLAARLLASAVDEARTQGFAAMHLEVAPNSPAVALYRKCGFTPVGGNGPMQRMIRPLDEEAHMTPPRNYNEETRDVTERRYAYGFDLDVMHPLMVRSFAPFFRPGRLLELGSYQGHLTQRLLERFDDVTCVEASDEALAEARRRVGARAGFVHATFETVTLPDRYDNIILTHVLEHLDDPVKVLRRVNDEWLAEGGRLFLACPNANAPSRQIAVKMGLITHHTAVTPAEAEHGHRCTYTLDTLERDAVAAGLKVQHRSGIFFKALANFQWDRLLQTDIISPEYLEGCYKLGQVYPDLCSSIFLVCEKGNARD